MIIIPIISRQIAFAKYDGQTGEISVYYHTGKVECYSGFDLDDLQAIVDASNRYDMLIHLTDPKRIPQPSTTT
ncbi:hypothetical protein [Paenibacillus lutrae]|uniref:KTSC domain-containing protein n=1 Tax=Paenibacillus lutrae TaxID=2078573 RepID=A0A7X3FG41_9BACL|nr:hypothetical protein [Paenibacillus lutrae]MVO98756.1 hypothetical protein [Paenibacillus lutrae]